jgi:hypothetical protein
MKTPDQIRIHCRMLLKENNIPLLHWPLARIVEAFPGKDGKIRVITAKTNAGLYKCGVIRVSPLPIE